MPKTRSVVFNTLMHLILLMVTLVIYQKQALAICAYYPGVYDGSSYTAISTGGVRSGYNSYGQYGTFTCQTTSGHSYWSPDTGYVAASAAPPPPPPPPANTSFAVINNTSETVSCYDNGVSIGPYSSSTCFTPTRVGLTQVPDFQNPSYYDTYRLSYYNGYTETTTIRGRNGPGMSYQSYDVPTSGQVVVDQYTKSCTQPYPVQPGCPVTTCNAPWGGTVANGASITAYSTSVAPYGSSCQPQTRTCSSGALSGSYAAQSCYVAPPANCTATSLNWGAANFCAKTTTTASHGAVQALTNGTAGATGTANATCSNGTWSVGSPVCTTSLTAPASLSATDGTVAGKITVTWGAVTGATAYDIQHRKQGATTWTTSTGVTSGWQLSATDESIYEFQVVAKNATGQGNWSQTETGFIRKYVDPVFVSQSGIPAKIGVGQSFTYSQVWQNNGSETWAAVAYGTGPFNPADTSVWGSGFVAYTGSTATGATVTTSLTAVAPTAPGTYPLQRVMQKSGTSYGAASAIASVIVVGSPTCSGVTPNVSTTFNPGAMITATLVGPSSVEAASVRVWGELQGEPSGATYPMTYNGSNWVATFPVASHLTSGETKINIRAAVSNSLFMPETACGNAAITYEELPLPTVTLEPTFGSFGDESRQGFVVNRQDGEFARISVNLGSHNSTLKARVEVLDGSNTNLIVALNSVTGGQHTTVNMSSSTLSAVQAAWVSSNATVRVTYADASASAQGKVVTIPIAWMAAPSGLTVTASGIQAASATVAATLNGAGGPFSTSTHGDFTGSVRVASSGIATGGTAPVSAEGAWTIANLDYAQLYNSQLVAVARAVPPAGVNLINPLEFASVTFILPVQAPVSVAATDGTLENDVQVVWPAIAPGSSIRYRVFRDGTEITPDTGISALEILDTPPKRGTIYNYTVKTMINNIMSQSEATDPGHVPACRAARFIGASIDASMSAINGMVESWECLEGLTGTGQIDSLEASDIEFGGTNPQYRKFSFPLPEGLADGAHTLRATMNSAGVTINATRTYDIPFVVDRAAITVNNLTILYDGSAAQNGLEATSIGRFGVKMDGGSGIGFAEELK